MPFSVIKKMSENEKVTGSFKAISYKWPKCRRDKKQLYRWPQQCCQPSEHRCRYMRALVWRLLHCHRPQRRHEPGRILKSLHTELNFIHKGVFVVLAFAFRYFCELRQQKLLPDFLISQFRKSFAFLLWQKSR